MKKLFWFAILLFAIVGAYIVYVPIVVVYSLKNLSSLYEYWRLQALAIDILIARGLKMKHRTISETIGKAHANGGGNWFTKLICKMIDVVDDRHCDKAARL